MPRVKKGVTARARHKSMLEMTKGQRASKHALFSRAKEAMMKSQEYAYFHRRERKGDMRKMWIARVGAATRLEGLKYSQLIFGLKKAGVTVNRKMMADLAVRDVVAFNNLVTLAKNNISG
jgi:large subunit ribosomal protein L20